jgi:hypothetical protein
MCHDVAGNRRGGVSTMSDVPGSEPSHAGAWTEDAYLALETAGRRIELIDGSLLVGPTSDDRHARAVAAVRAAVRAALPEGLEVTGPVALRLAPGRILVPDLVVAAPADPDAGDVRDSSDALAVIDVVGAGNGVADRWFKPQLYAGSRIPYALLVDHDDPFAVGSMLIGGRYHEYAAAEGYGVLRLDEPFPLELDLATLTAPAAGSDAAGSDAAEHDGEPSSRGPAEGWSSVAEPDAVEPAAGRAGTGESGAGESGTGEWGTGEWGAESGSARGVDAEESGARVNGAEAGSPRDPDPGPHRSHPDEDHSVHA